MFCWSSKFVLLFLSNLPAAREAIHVSKGSCVTSVQRFMSLQWKHSCAFLLMVFFQSIITRLWLLPGGLTQAREQGDQTTMINLHMQCNFLKAICLFSSESLKFQPLEIEIIENSICFTFKLLCLQNDIIAHQ